MQGRGLGWCYVDGLACAHQVGSALAPAIDQNAPVFDPALNPRTAELREPLMQHLVKPLAGIGDFRGKALGCSHRVSIWFPLGWNSGRFGVQNETGPG